MFRYGNVNVTWMDGGMSLCQAACEPVGTSASSTVQINLIETSHQRPLMLSSSSVSSSSFHSSLPIVVSSLPLSS